ATFRLHRRSTSPSENVGSPPQEIRGAETYQASARAARTSAALGQDQVRPLPLSFVVCTPPGLDPLSSMEETARFDPMARIQAQRNVQGLFLLLSRCLGVIKSIS